MAGTWTNTKEYEVRMRVRVNADRMGRSDVEGNIRTTVNDKVNHLVVVDCDATFIPGPPPNLRDICRCSGAIHGHIRMCGKPATLREGLENMGFLPYFCDECFADIPKEAVAKETASVTSEEK